MKYRSDDAAPVDVVVRRYGVSVATRDDTIYKRHRCPVSVAISSNQTKRIYRIRDNYYCLTGQSICDSECGDRMFSCSMRSLPVYFGGHRYPVRRHFCLRLTTCNFFHNVRRMDQTLRMRQVRTHVTSRSPFVASLMLSLEFIPDPTVKTMETDGVFLYYNPDWFDSLRFTQACFSVAHEAFHCAANHPLRIGDRDLVMYNHAADYVTNPLVFQAGFDDPPDGILLDQRFINMSVERVYNILEREKPPEQGGGGGSGNQPQKQGSQPQGDPKPGDNIPDDLKQMDVGGCGGFFPPRNVDGKPFSTEQKERLRDKWEMTATHAKMVARRIGNCPGSAETIVNEIQNPKADWKIVTRRFMQAMASHDYSWLRPDRRLVHRKLWVPDLVTDGMPGMVVGCDTSISMTPRMLATIETEFNSILLDTMPAWVDVFLGDTEIHRQVRYYPNEYPVKFSFPGRGGTRVQPFFDAIDKLEYTPVCFVHFSDLEISDFPDQEPAYPVLWASTEKTEIPWGELVMVDEV